MAREKVDKELRKSILGVRRIVGEAEKADCNESATRQRVERIFETIMGYDVFKHLSHEYEVKGAGEAVHVDYAIQLEEGRDVKPEIMVEIKRVCVDLASKHLRQVASYAIDAGCEWIILTNAKEWQLYHVSFEKPPVTKLLYAWNLLTDDVSILAQRFDLISYGSVKKEALPELWRKINVLGPDNLLQAILSDSSLSLIRRELRKKSGILLSPEDVVSGIRRMLNESALAVLEKVRIYLPGQKQKQRTKRDEAQEVVPQVSTEERPDSTPSEGVAPPNV